MITGNGRNVNVSGIPSADGGFPSGSVVQHLQFVSERQADQEVLLELPHPINRRAVLTTPSEGPRTTSSGKELAILSIPTTDIEDVDLLCAAQDWVEAAPGGKGQSHLMTLQGTQIFWTDGRLAILAHDERLDTIRAALIEVFFYDAELRELELAVAESWPGFEADIPSSFEFTERSFRHRKQLQRRHQQVFLMRARLERIAPHVHCPHVYPVTLASQVGERLKERKRMPHRHEFLDEQLEFLQQVYDSCGQRSSEYGLTRSSKTLEMVIILLLMTQILFQIFELLTKTSS